MQPKPHYVRPTFEQPFNAWKALVKERNLPTELVWVFDENLCFERDPAAPGGFRLGFQTAFSPPPPDALSIAYDYFRDFDARIVFYRIGSSAGRSVCALLCDDWLESRGEPDGYVRRDDWLISFRPGGDQSVEEITDAARWRRRVVRGRPLHDLDFCMTLQAMRELLAHERVLTAYERYALKLLNAWRQIVHSHPKR